MDTYDPRAIEAKWQRVREDARAFYVDDPPPEASRDEKFYQLEMLPYPSGDLHMGHVLNYTLGDVVTHFQRRHGKHVLRPMGWDSFGLPAENAAIREGGNPREITERNIVDIERQMHRLGWAIDWDRVIAAHDPAYYRWTQWLFLRFLEKGLAYRKEAPVNWCPNDQTVLANEQVVNGHCDRCGAAVEVRKMEQWFFRITAYADALLRDDELIDWPERTKTIQRNWIGRSEGAELLFRIDSSTSTRRSSRRAGHGLRGDLLRAGPGASAGRHDGRALAERRGVARLCRRRAGQACRGTGFGRGEDWRLHRLLRDEPGNRGTHPGWVADYVLMEYGTGAIMAVPGHDERDREFAERFELPVVEVIDEEAGALVESAQFSGMAADEAKPAIVEWLGKRGRGRPAVSFRLRDWGFSRQRYWGAPIPIVYCGECGIVPVPDDQLPVLLPEVDDYRPKGKPPLASNEEWLNVPCPSCGGPGQREAETMDTFVDSAWNFLRYCDPHNDREPFSRPLVDFWGPVDQYIGGIDHATGHLLYSRFFVKVLNELGMVGFREPFQRLFHQGWVRQGGTKMSKSRGNVTAPDQLAEMYGADAVRLYILFVGPADQDMDWTEEGIDGIGRFLRRLWRIVHEAAEGPGGGEDRSSGPLLRKAHETIAKVTDDIGRRFVFNTPIAAVMELVNELGRDPSAPGARFAAETAVSLIQPYAPHVAEELWATLGHERLWEQPWPVADESQLERETFQLVLQVNGRVRDRVEASVGESEDELVERAKASPRVQAHLDGKEIRQTIVVPGKLVNLVV